MKEQIIQKTFSNGIKCVLAPNVATKAVTVLVLFGTGSRYEPDRLAGISHFLEHMYFKGSKRRPSALKVAEELDSMGSAYNAFTGKEYTGYYIKAGGDNFTQMLDILSDLLFNPLFDPKEMEKEKGAVVQELNMYEDAPSRYVDDLYELNIFGREHSLGRLIIGTREKVKAIKRSELLSYLKKHYFGSNTVISIAGSIGDTEKTFKEVEKFFGKMARGKKVNPQKFVKPKAKTPLVQYKETEQTHLMLGALGYSYTDKKRLAYKVLSTILGGGMSSRLFIKIRERRGLAYNVHTSTTEYLDTGTLVTQAGIDNDKVYEAVKVIVDEYRNFARTVTSKELIKAKQLIKGHWILDYEDSMSVAMRLGMDSRYNVPLRSLDDKIMELERLKLDDVRAVAQEVMSRELSLALIGPFKDTEKFAKLISGKR